MSENYILQLKNITKDFPGTRALDNVNVSVLKGEVHAIIGENGAGKSTLMNIIGGVFHPTSGDVCIDGQSVKMNSPLDSQKLGVGFVHQELSLCPHMTVAENIFIGRLPKNKMGMVDYNKINKESAEYLSLFAAKINPTDLASSLTTAEQQIVEIVKALSFNCKILILDEPTSSLTENEAEELFKIVKDLKKKGISILYISHRMREIFELCDRVTVFRDGQWIDTCHISEVTMDELIGKMVGRTIGNIYPEKNSKETGKELLRIEKLNKKGVFNDICFSLYEHEILGFYGLVGSGRTEVMKAICGIDKLDSGAILLYGEEVNIKEYKNSVDCGLVYLTEDRKTEGLFLDYSIASNISVYVLNKILKNKMLNSKLEISLAEDYSSKVNVKMTSVVQNCSSLSGGNQQKVLFAKSLAAKPKILIVDEPTRGIDVKAKAEIYKILRQLSDEGIGIIIISSELPEAIGMSDRMIIMHEGSITGIVTGEEIEEKTIVKYASAIG